MEISIKDIIKAVMLKWYLMLAIVSICVVVGTVIGVNNYNKPRYTATTSFLFSNIPPATNINLYVGNSRAYLLTEFITYKVSDKIAEDFEGNRDYEVTIEIISATLALKVTAENEAIAKAVLNEYKEIILSPENLTKKDDVVIEVLVPISGREQKPSLTSLIIQISLFGFIGLFIGSIIILSPLYAEKAKEERLLNSRE